jgi:hypothetical protein
MLLFLASNSDFTDPVIIKNQILTNQYTVSGNYPELLLVDQTYYWKIAGISESGFLGNFSGTWSFDIDYPDKLTHGPMAAAVTPDSAKIWIRTSEAADVIL